MTLDPTPDPIATDPVPGDSATVLGSRFRWITIGMCSLIFLAAFEALAVTTVMPTISRELGGSSLYALAFAGPLAVGVIGMVVAGNWSDRSGPTPPLLTAVALFVAGLALAGLAPAMPILVLGRLVHGLGGGGLTVALYVMLARIYPARLHPSIFAGFAAAWVVPSLIGPFVAGLVAQYLSWHWVFLGVILLVLPALAMMRPAIHLAGSGPAAAGLRWDRARILWACVVAAAVLGVNLASSLPAAVRWPATLLAAALGLAAARPLLPTGTLAGRSGLPSVILVRGLVAGAFASAEVYIPYVLTDRHHWSPSVAGLALTGGALAWSLGSMIQSRYAVQVTHRAVVRVGAVLVTVSIGNALATTALGLPGPATVAGWVFGGLGMGLLYPRTSTAMLALSTDRDRGFNSSGLAIADATGSALAIASAGLVFGSLSGVAAAAPFSGAFAVGTVLALAALSAVRGFPAGRVGDTATSAETAAEPATG